MAKKHPETNPFVQNGSGFTINAVWKFEELVSSGVHLVDAVDGKSSSQYRAYKYEKDDRISLYTAGLLGFFPSLSTSSKDMIMYIASRVQYDSDIIELEEEKYCTVMNVSRSTFYSAKKEIVNRIIIPRTSRKNTYWINPSYLFRGNRMEKYPKMVKMHNDHPFDKLTTNLLEEPDILIDLD